MAVDELDAEPDGARAAGKVLPWLAIVLPVALILLGVWTTPDPRGYGTHEQLGLPACPSRALFQIPCPGCGATTALALFARGSFGASLLAHPFAFLVALAVSLCAPVVLFDRLRGRDPAARWTRVAWRRVVLTAAALWLVSWAWTLSR